MKQYIARENYPEYYERNQNCSFNFRAPAGRRILVFFVDFELEHRFDFICEQGISAYWPVMNVS